MLSVLPLSYPDLGYPNHDHHDHCDHYDHCDLCDQVTTPGALNHGIEVRKQAVEHSYQCLEKYITQCIMFDATGLAIPLFVCGNGLDIDTGESSQRVQHVEIE